MDMNQSATQENGFEEVSVSMPISRKLAFAFIGMILFTAIVSAVTLIGLTSLNEAVDEAINFAAREATLTDAVDSSLLEARRREKDYLLRYESLGFEEARSEYVTGVRAATNAIRASLDELKGLYIRDTFKDEATLQRDLEELEEIERLVDQYEVNFLLAVDEFEERGFIDSGLEGQFRDAVHNLENAIESETTLESSERASIEIAILQLRRKEKDYLLRGTDNYITDVHTQAQKLQSEIANTSLSVSKKRTYNGFVDAYLTSFDALVAKDIEVAASIELFRDSAHDIGPLTADLRQEALAQEETSVTNVTQITSAVSLAAIIVVIVAVILGAIVAILINRSIADPIRDLSAVARKVAAGDLDVRAQVQSGDEIGVLAGIFNQMIDRLQQMLQDEQQQREEVEVTISNYSAHMTLVSSGNLSARLTLANGEQSKDDPLIMLGHAMNTMTADLEHMVDQIESQRARLQSAVVEYVEHLAIVAGGDLSARLILNDMGTEEQDPLLQLGHSINDMTGDVRRMLSQIEEQRTHLQSTIEQYGAHLADVTSGDLTKRLTLITNGEGVEDDPLIALGEYINDMTSSLQRSISEQRDAATDLKVAIAEILAATTQQLSGASEQSAAATQTGTTVDEVLVISQEAINRSKEVLDVAQRTAKVSRDGTSTVQHTIESMSEIKILVEDIAENILMLSEQTQQIGEIITVVNEIAAQSNMLALNASVEAARAGQHGKGFAVVAGEVRNLAEQSRQATTQVQTILNDIQRATNTTVMATEEGSKGVDRGVRLASEAQTVIEQLTQVIEESAQAASQMMTGGQQQVSGIEQIALAMKNIQQTSVQNLTASRQTEKSAQQLDKLAGKLTEMVEEYSL